MEKLIRLSSGTLIPAPSEEMMAKIYNNNLIDIIENPCLVESSSTNVQSEGSN